MSSPKVSDCETMKSDVMNPDTINNFTDNSKLDSHDSFGDSSKTGCSRVTETSETEDAKTMATPERTKDINSPESTTSEIQKTDVIKNAKDVKTPEKPKNLSETSPRSTSRSGRAVKKVHRFTSEEKSEDKSEKFEIPVGRGTKFADCPIIANNITYNHIDDLKPLHSLLYGKTPKSQARTAKQNILQFSGFGFDVDSKEYRSKKNFIDRFTVPGLKFVTSTLDIPWQSAQITPEMDKDQRSECFWEARQKNSQRLMDFLMEPRPSGKEPPAWMNQSAPDSSGKKRKRSSSHSVSASPKKKQKSNSLTVTVISPTKKKATKKSAKKSDGGSSSDESSEPLVKKKKTSKPRPPTDKQLTVLIRSILDGANLELITMKQVCNMVYEKYPNFNLTHRKDFIKTTVKQMISQNPQ